MVDSLSHMADTLAQFADRIRACGAARTPIRLRGSGTKDFYGRTAVGEVLDTRAHAGIVDYDPTELYVTARCGTPLAELEATLAGRGQMLAFEPPHYGAGATLGGAVAAGLSGPRRQAAGSLRDYVLGVRMMDGRGDDLFFGGQVMKNVAGYDVSRLMAGALGTLGLVLEVTLKVLPTPVAEVTLALEIPEDKAIEVMNRWAGKPLPVSATAWCENTLGVRLSGAAAAVSAAREKIGGEPVDPERANRFWTSIREQTDEFFGAHAPLWRLSVPSVTPPLSLPGEQLIEWGGALRWLLSTAEPRDIRDAATRAGGHATLFRGGDRSGDVFHPLEAPLAHIHRRLKAQFDPHGIFNPGRMYADQ